MTPMNQQTMSLKNKLLISGGVVLLAAAAALYVGLTRSTKSTKSGSPIEVGDGSIVFRYPPGINKNSNQEVEVREFPHKVTTITFGYYNSQPTATFDVRKRDWTLTSDNNPAFQVSLRSHWLGLGKGVVGQCAYATGWSGGSVSYICPVGSPLTPATLTFTDGEPCPGTKSPACKLGCPPTPNMPQPKCELQLEYK